MSTQLFITCLSIGLCCDIIRNIIKIYVDHRAELNLIGKSMIEYSIKHHVPGRIRLFIPQLRKLPVEKLQRLAAAVTPTPRGVQDVSANPITGSLVVKYDPKGVDILQYIKAIASDEKIRAIVEGE
jgi:Heavy metal associated domain 2